MTPLESWFTIGFVLLALLLFYAVIAWAFPNRSDRSAEQRAAEVQAELERRWRAFEIFDEPGRAERIVAIRAGRRRV